MVNMEQPAAVNELLAAFVDQLPPTLTPAPARLGAGPWNR